MYNVSTPIEYLKGVGPARANLLKKELGIFTYLDLISHYPFRYIDRSKIYTVKELEKDMPFVQLKGKFIHFKEEGVRFKKRFIGSFQDKTGIIDLVWFQGIKWIKSSIQLNQEYLVFGKPTYFKGRFNIVHPELDILGDLDKQPISFLQPVYSTTEKLTSKGLNSRGISKLTKLLLSQVGDNIDETLSESIIQKLKISKREAIQNIHFPEDTRRLNKAREFLKFEELFFLQLHLLKIRIKRVSQSVGYSFDKVGDFFNSFYSNYLSFELTGAQKKVLKEIRSDLGKNKQMNRLLQGDVGSGKTLVALLSMLIAIDNNYQTCIMVPTEILAHQHFNTISNLLSQLNIKVDLLTGSTKKKERNKLYERIQNGTTNILIGTHALLEDKVAFQNLGLAVIDEQHRFGVVQRSKLWGKNKYPPHILVMTATPIPRTLSMTLYGDLDVSIIDELPPGRKEVKTVWRSESSRLQIIDFIKSQVHDGRQIYIVYPLIKESEKLDYKNLIDGFESIVREFPLPDYQVSVVHGKMKAEAKEYEMKRFVDGITNILVSTTVIEVGVDVPNASVMIIESAERFGLSQLHQLRGRVGRGSQQSYCILVSGHKISKEGKLRLKTMSSTNDGFKISEVDLEIRGPGDVMGTKQSGILDFKIADIVTDGKILDSARKNANQLLISDPNIQDSKNINIARGYSMYSKEKLSWSKIS
ncbi:MAG: ATP-dependent DNA helicase RecG [Bacteroidota bacterium]|nr:ATP-dependent DNA helicase RecG [Bacteroidota bacterium]